MDSFNPDSISQVSHKLRTPLTVIMSTVNNLLDGAYGKLTPDQKIWIQKLSKHTQTLEGISNDILSLLKSQAENLNVDAIKDKTHESNKTPVSAKLPQNNRAQHETPLILIVDDEPDILDTIEEGMHMKGFKTATADNGEDAVKLAHKMNPDLVLMDVLLKHQNGMEVCEKIKSETAGYVPVVMVTGQNDYHEKFTGEKNAPDDLLMKPFQMEELFSRVHSMLRIKKLHDELAQFKTGEAA